MLAKIATAGQNGQFRTRRHIIRLMVEMTAPQPRDVICDPACGTAGFLVAAGGHLREHHPEMLHHPKENRHFHYGMFHGFDFDNTMLRIDSMNMLLHGVENPDIRYRDSSTVAGLEAPVHRCDVVPFGTPASFVPAGSNLDSPDPASCECPSYPLTSFLIQSPPAGAIFPDNLLGFGHLPSTGARFPVVVCPLMPGETTAKLRRS